MRTSAACRRGALPRCRRRSSPPARSRAGGSESISSPRFRRCSIGVELDAQLLDLLRALTVGFLDLRRVEPLPLRRATSSPDVFCSRFSPSSSGSRRRRRASSAASSSSSRVKSIPRLLQRGSNGLEVVSEKCGINHGLRDAFVRIAMRDSIRRLPAIGWRHGWHDPQGRLPCRGSRHPIPARDQGAAERDAGARRQAGHPVRRRGGRPIRRRQHRHRDRPRQERDRGSLRRRRGAGELSRAARQDCAARGNPQDHEADQRVVRPPGRAARPRPRRARDARTWLATSRSP